MDFNYSEKTRQLQTQLRNFMEDHVMPRLAQWQREVHAGSFPVSFMEDLKALAHRDVPGETRTTRTICPYCGVGCAIDVMTRDGKMVGVLPAMDGPANEGALCIKGQYAWDFVQHQDRLTTPLVRIDAGELVPASWDEALTRAAEGFKKVADRYGPQVIYGIASGRAPNEVAYAMQKLMRAGWGLNHIDHCARA